MFRDFFYMTKSDRRIILSALVLIGVAVAVIFLAGGRDKAQDSTAVQQAIADSTENAAASEVPVGSEAPLASASHELFAFDPNTADSLALLRLGLSKWQIRNIYKYRAAGGIYRSKEDFARLYGLTVRQYRELEPYITIGADFLPASTLFPDRKAEYTNGGTERHDSTFTPRYPVKLTEGETIDLATADTALLQRVPGIGSYYARRIAEYRQRLGGFADLSQLDEIDGFPHESLPYFTLNAGSSATEKLNVNSLSINELKRHPYINFYMARAIVDYRRQNGPITDINELRLLPDFDDATLNRLRPYVSY